MRKVVIVTALFGVLVSGPAWAENKLGTVCGNFEFYAIVAYHRLAFLSTKTGYEIEKKDLKKEYDNLVHFRAPNLIQAMKNLDCDMDTLKEKLDEIACDAALHASKTIPCKK